jgi:hypothetical protein
MNNLNLLGKKSLYDIFVNPNGYNFKENYLPKYEKTSSGEVFIKTIRRYGTMTCDIYLVFQNGALKLNFDTSLVAIDSNSVIVKVSCTDAPFNHIDHFTQLEFIADMSRINGIETIYIDKKPFDGFKEIHPAPNYIINTLQNSKDYLPRLREM